MVKINDESGNQKLKKPVIIYEGNLNEIKTECKSGTPLNEVKEEHKKFISANEII